MVDTKEAIEITEETLLRVPDGPYPVKDGNCFGVRTSDGKHYGIVNFSAENLKEAVRRGVTWPIRILPLDETRAVIHDARIPDEWYDQEWCEICCPSSLLPLPQRLVHDRQTAGGVRTKTRGFVRLDFTKSPVLPEPPTVKPLEEK